MAFGVLALFGSHKWVQLTCPRSPRAPSPVVRVLCERLEFLRRQGCTEVLWGEVLAALITTFCFVFQSCAQPLCSSGTFEHPQLEKVKVFLFV